MNIEGIIINHECFGEGKITEVSNGYLHVQFGQEIKRFTGEAIGKYLSFRNKKDEQIIESALETDREKDKLNTPPVRSQNEPDSYLSECDKKAEKISRIRKEKAAPPHMVINESLREIEKDLLKRLEKEPSLEPLRNLRFDSEVNPDYNNPQIQLLYLLRYFYAYSYEYYLAFKGMLALVNGEIEKDSNVLSIGCGAAFDYWALKRAVNYDNSVGHEEVFNYTGVDEVSWLHPCSKEGKDSLNICKKDFISWLSVTPTLFSISDIIIFPKSIGEFSEEYFSKMLSEIEKDKCKITRKTVAVIGSFRRSKHDFDVERFDRFVNRLRASANYIGIEKMTKNYLSEIEYPAIPQDNKYFFGYPKNIKNKMLSLFNYCKRYKQNGNKHCTGCICTESNVFKYPITTKKYIDYKIVILKRGES